MCYTKVKKSFFAEFNRHVFHNHKPGAPLSFILKNLWFIAFFNGTV